MLDQKQKLYIGDRARGTETEREISVFQIKSPISGVKKMVTEGLTANGLYIF